MHSAIVFLACLAVAHGGLVYSSGPIVAPVGLTSSQFHAQDELGQYSYGYAGGPSAKSESKDAFGNVRGGYSYIDANGITQTVNYVADPVNGFRVAATNLPVGPAPVASVVAGPAQIVESAVVRSAVPVGVAVGHVGFAQPVAISHAAGGPTHIAALPLPPADTPEVQLAKAQHFAAKAAVQG